MTERPDRRPPDDGPRSERPPSGRAPEEFDREIDVRAVLSFGAALALVMIVVLGLMWLLIVQLRGRAIARDPRPLPFAEAHAPRRPPEPRLQDAPVEDMQAMRARETAILESYGWVDRAGGIGRIPIERAMEILLEEGLPGTGAPSAAAPPATRAGATRKRGRS